MYTSVYIAVNLPDTEGVHRLGLKQLVMLRQIEIQSTVKILGFELNTF